MQQRGTTYNDTCRQYTNYVTRRYGHAIIVFDGYQEELSTKDGPHERRTGGRAGPTVDFTRDIVMKSKKEGIISNKDNKQRFIRMLGQRLEHVGCETRHDRISTTVQSAMSCETIPWLAMARICVCFCVFMSRKIPTVSYCVSPCIAICLILVGLSLCLVGYLFQVCPRSIGGITMCREMRHSLSLPTVTYICTRQLPYFHHSPTSSFLDSQPIQTPPSGPGLICAAGRVFIWGDPSVTPLS